MSEAPLLELRALTVDIPVPAGTLHAVRGLRRAADVGPVVVAAPAADVELVRALLDGLDVVVVAGGAERQDSVRAALAALPCTTPIRALPTAKATAAPRNAGRARPARAARTAAAR